MLGPLLSLALTASPATAVLHHRSDGTASCPGEDWLVGNVSGRLGYQPFQPEAPVTLETSVRCGSSGCTAKIALVKPGEPTRVRTLSAAGDQCRELMESLALALALAVDPQLLSRTRPAPPAPPPPTPAAPPPAAPPVPPSRIRLHALGGIQGTVGVSPRPAFSGLLGFGFQVGWFSLTAEGRADVAQVIPVPGGVVRSQVLLGSLLPCGTFHRVGLCLAASLGALQVEGALSGGRRTTTPLALLGARLQYQYDFLSWLAVRAHLGLQAVLTRTTVIVAAEPVWTTGQLAGDLGLTVVALF